MIGLESTITAGDTYARTFSLAAHTPGGGWLITYFIRGASALTVAAVANGQQWTLALTGAQTSTLAAGVYAVAGVATRQGERITFDRGQVTVEANVEALAAGHDPRTIAERTLANIEATLLGTASKSILKQSVDGLELEKYPIPDLLRLRDVYKAAVRQEKLAAALAKDAGAGRVLVQFGGG